MPHSPGPFTSVVGTNKHKQAMFIKDAAGNFIAKVYGHQGVAKQPVVDNAELFVAAPSLLALVKRLYMALPSTPEHAELDAEACALIVSVDPAFAVDDKSTGHTIRLDLRSFPESDIRMVRSGGEACANVPRAVTHHSPDGYEWGYTGSGPADLALNIMHALFPIVDTTVTVQLYRGKCSALTWSLYQKFKERVVARVPREGGVITRAQVAAFLSAEGVDVPKELS